MTHGLRILIVWLLVPLQMASATEYREIALADGRVLTAQVLETEGTTMWVRTPLGVVAVDLLKVNSLETITRADYSHQSPLTVLLLPFLSTSPEMEPVAEVSEGLVMGQLKQMSGLVTIRSADLSARLGTDSSEKLDACGADLGCSLSLVAPQGVDLVIQGDAVAAEGGFALSLHSAIATAPDYPLDASFEHQGTEGLGAQLHSHLLQILGVQEIDQPIQIEDPPRGVFTPAPTSVATAETRRDDEAKTDRKDRASSASGPTPPSARTLSRTALVPIPGLPALLKRDIRSFGMAWGVVVPTTVGMVALVGQSSYQPGQFNVMSALCYYALTVGANRRFGLESPSADGSLSSRR